MILVRIFLLASLALGFFVASAQAQLRATDLIIDEFDEAVSIALPVPLVGGNEVVQTDIGPLFASRRTRTFDLNLRARGEYGAANSVLNANVTGATPVSNNSKQLAFGGEYELSTPLNLPELGYDALAIDFRSMDSSLGSVPRVDTFLRTTQQASLFYSSQYDIPLSDSSFTLLFPLDSFGDRGAGSGDDFDDVVSVWFYVFPVYLTGASPDMTFSMQIDRIRFTTLAVPEPASVALIGAAVGASLIASRRRRRPQCEP